MSHVVATGGDAHSRESVEDLLDLLVSGGGVYLDVRMVHQDVVQVGNLQTQPFLAEEKREAVLQCLEIFRPGEYWLIKLELRCQTSFLVVVLFLVS